MEQKKNRSDQKFVDTAHLLFSRHGYAGVSLAEVAGELDLTKQAILYHFSSKERLYRAVLEQLAERFESLLSDVQEKPGSGEERLRSFIESVFCHFQESPADAQLIARELLDNVERAESNRKWYLRPFLDAVVELLRELPRWRSCNDGELAAAAYQIIGAINYYAISGHTLRAIWGKDRLESMDEGFLAALERSWLRS